MTRRQSILTLALVLPLALSCGSDANENNGPIIIDNNGTTNNGGANNGGGNNGGTNNGGANNGGTNNGTNVNEDCPPEARPVYLVEADTENPDAQGSLIRFTPQDRTFTDLGQLNCPVQGDATPFSMSIDRDATAWVLYSSGNIFKVSTDDASCEATNYQPGQEGYDVFGMGFVLNNPDHPAETLYIAGGSGPSSQQQPRIGYLTFPDMVVHDSAPIDGWPEMSGTAAANLWAFFPNPISGSARIAKLLPATGEEEDSIPVDSVITGQAHAWAFAHWGGRFYLFYKSQDDASTNVFEVQKDGTIEEILPDTGRYIVGAGVSTCAPLVLL